MKNNYALNFSYQRRQLRHLAKRLLRLQEFGQKIPQALLARFRHLAKQLLPRLGTNGLKRTLGTAAFLLGIGTASIGQTFFTEPIFNPFGIVNTSTGYLIPALADLDDDGDLDLLRFSYYGDPVVEISYQENIGTAEAPAFGPVQDDPFNILVPTSNLISADAIDLDGDGDFDLIFGSYTYDPEQEEFGQVLYLENIGSNTNPSFAAAQQDAFGLLPSYNPIALTLGDLDDDGDLDVIKSFYEEPNFKSDYFENIGTATMPNFMLVEGATIGLEPNDIIAAYGQLADLDGDGDLDFLIGSYDYDMEIGKAFYQENGGSATNPDFQPPIADPFGLDDLQEINGFFIFELADLDNDGDKDILAARYGGDLIYYENTDITSAREQAGNFPLAIFPNPTTGALSIQTEKTIQYLEVNNVLGQRIKTYWQFNDQELDLTGLSPGSYLIKVVTTDNQFKVLRVQKH